MCAALLISVAAHTNWLTLPSTQVAGSPAELASKTDYCFAMLSDPPAALEVADQVIAGMPLGK